MSEAHHSDHSAAHDAHHGGEGAKSVSMGVLAAFVVPVVVIVSLVSFLGPANRDGAGSGGMAAEAVARRIQPVASVELKDASAGPAVLKTGEQVFQAQCSACHTTGAAGAPKVGDDAAWGARIKTGYDALLTSAVKGKGNMPPQGGGELSDTEIGRGVVYMANKAGGKFDEPKAPAAAASAAEPAASATK